MTFRNDAQRVAAALRPDDHLFVRDNSRDNIGFAAAANELARRGTGDVILFVNPDGDPRPGCFDALEAAVGIDGVVAVEASQGPRWDRPAIDASGMMQWLSAACLAVRRRAFEAVGGFDERLFMYCEDVDLSYRLARLGSLRHCGNAVFQHDAGSRGFLALHRNFRNWLVVQRRWERANWGLMLRNAGFDARRLRFIHAAARVSGTLDYWVRAWRWA